MRVFGATILGLLGVACGSSGGSGGGAPPIQIPVLDVVPANGSIDVARDTALWVRFSEALDPTSLSPDTVIANDGHGEVRGSSSYEPATSTLRCVLERPLARDTVVVVTLSGTLRTATQRVFGTALTWSFATLANGWSEATVLGESTADRPLVVARNAGGVSAVGYGEVIHTAAPDAAWSPAVPIPNLAGTPFLHEVRVLPGGSVLVGWSASEGEQRITRLSQYGAQGGWLTTTIHQTEETLWGGTTFFTSTRGHVLARVAVDQRPLPWHDLRGFWSAAAPPNERLWMPTGLLWYWRAGADQVSIDDVGGFARYSQGAFSTPPMLGYFDLRSGQQSFARPSFAPLALFLADDGTQETLEWADQGSGRYQLAVRGMRSNQPFFDPVVSSLENVPGVRTTLSACAANGDLAVVLEIKVEDGVSRLLGLGFDAEQRRWTPVQELAAREPWLPAPRKFVLAMGPRGDGWLVHARQGAAGSGDPLVGYRYRAKRGFGPQRQLTTLGVGGLRTHAVAVDADGSASVAWLDFLTPPIATSKVRVIRSD